MYSEKITQSQIEKVEARLKFKLVRYERDNLLDRRAHLDKIFNNGEPKRSWTSEDLAFFRNEQLLCRLDWNYFVSRYCWIMLGGINESGMGLMDLWESQKIIIALVAKLEELAYDAIARGEPCDGILIALNKARQLGATMISRSIVSHRIYFWDHVAAFSASVDDDKILELYDRDKRIYDNLPFYVKPSLDPRDGSIDQQAQYLKCGTLDSSILYQTAQQKSGLGQGRKFDVSHLTEVASFEYFGKLEHDFMPTLPQSPSTFCLMESTPQGRGNPWHIWTEQVRLRQITRWHYLFIPVYIEKKRYRRTPPLNWVPATLTMEYAQQIERTSPEIVGYKVVPEKDFLYWWETTRAEYEKNDALAIFLTNYAATPEESFQFNAQSAFPAQLLQEMAMHLKKPVKYEFVRAQA